MALIFQRLARNFIKNGYFPTDETTIERLLAMFDVKPGKVRLIDPCCGEGIALAECANYLHTLNVDTFSAGIEYEAERALNAKTLLDHVVHSDIQDCVVSSGQFNLLWLNPPYGDRITDQVYRDRSSAGRDRLEKYFLSRTLPMLHFGGLLIYIIPHYVLDKHLARQLVRSLDELSCYRLPEERFKQVVVIGHRRRTDGQASAALVNHLIAIANDRDLAPLLPEIPDRLYAIPVVTTAMENKTLEIRSSRPTLEQVEEVSRQHPCLWTDFAQHFKQRSVVKRRPARALSDWHLALMLAAGQVSGVVTSAGGRKLLVKGGTHKEKESSLEITENEDGTVEETRVLTDRFVPIIKAIDVEPTSAEFGQVFTIR
ncbi:O-methyltransferase [Cellvibrio zantedeschiae]|uniref:O-methyltransferase n=1 Tax=Cellvibrio zantedeschiae TaxID=1237077 RepID=A0ABQ3B5S8_9GAMM|nr:DUF6094 domain-containing protein [Cellvibrio zantedeschiae]GGY79530.1 O-methyltransferase [Cellvibrio zantedeschiae]